MDNLSPFEVLADPVRRRIVELLRAGEMPVGELTAALDIRQSGVSRHLRILGQAGFVAARPEGQKRYYALRPEPFVELQGWLGHYRALWEGRLERFGRALEARQKSSRSTRRNPGG